MQTFKQKLLVGLTATLFFGATVQAVPHDPLDSAALATAVEAGTVKLGETMTVRAFVPVDSLRCYNNDDAVIFAGIDGNAENLGMYMHDTKRLCQKIPGPIDEARGHVNGLHQAGKFAKIGIKKPIGEIKVGPMETVTFVATETGWELEEEELVDDAESELVAHLRDEVSALTRENKTLKDIAVEDSVGLQTTIKERDDLKIDLEAARNYLAPVIKERDELKADNADLAEQNDTLKTDIETAAKDLEDATKPETEQSKETEKKPATDAAKK